VARGDELARIETIKVDLELASPCDGLTVANNPALAAQPELINSDPYGAGWLLEMQPASWPVPGLLAAADYLALMQRQLAAGDGQ
jgi:glycine cleavage system H protein